MDLVIKQIQLIKRADVLIRLQATGSPDTFAKRLQISKTKLYRVLDVMKKLNAPIQYDSVLKSFVYQNAVGFTVGFFDEEKVGM